MRGFSRAVLALILGVAGIAGLASLSIGQDGNVQKASSAGSQGTQPRALPAAVLGSIDMDAVFKGYEKVEFIRKQIEAEANLKKSELSKIMAQAQQIAKEMESLQPGSPDFKERDNKLTKLRVELDGAREQAQREFASREADALATIHKEIQAMVEAVAKYNHMTYVVRISSEPITGGDPNSVLAAMSRSVVYSDPSTDITGVVVRMLNKKYKENGGQKATGDPDTAPASATTTSPAAAPASTQAAPATNPATARGAASKSAR
jgi:outer membrane protein